MALLLITGIMDFHLGYGYFQILRWVVCVCASLVAFDYYKTNSKMYILYLIIAILFNPIAPIFLGKDLWKLLDILCMVAFVPAFIKAKI
jgi:uncharacterized membrane protein YqaE (UPF0057 family)